MDFNAFKQQVRSEFGPGLKHATPANVREFLDRVQIDDFKASKGSGRIEINETATTYEEIIKDFFSRILDAPSEEAIIKLWTLALDLSFAAIEHQYADQFAKLLGDQDE
jgi:hypothetical protein